ncbi:uncharacterized protein LOC142786172 [Rhipicephalus microplus]|uniref:uncharacterized protein LOC142786172 n=1 Tax=Rhipicephalus microplus TaxID=6941 RepID=UPI003F6CB2DC
MRVITRHIGSIPASMILGGIVDQTCLAWHRLCGSSGNCIAYEAMAGGMLYSLSVMLALSMLLYYLSLLAHRRHLRMRKDSIPIPVLYVGSRSQTIASPASLSETTVSPVDPAEPSPGQ